MPRATILDLSHNNPDIQFHEAKAAGILLVFLKASQGSGFKDATFNDRAARARECGLRVGAYHFADGSDVSAQIANFEAAISGVGPLLHCLDFESNPAGGDVTAPIGAEWVSAITATYGRHPVVYGSDYLPQFAADDYSSAIIQCPLWIARYSSSAPEVPAPWAEYAMWQYSETGPILGRTDLDLSCYNGSVFGDDDEFVEWVDSRMVSA